MTPRPIEGRQHTGERSDEPLDRVGDDGHAERREPRGIAVGIEHQPPDLGRGPPHHLADHGGRAQRREPLVTTAHAPRQPTREDDAHQPVLVVDLHD